MESRLNRLSWSYTLTAFAIAMLLLAATWLVAKLTAIGSLTTAGCVGATFMALVSLAEGRVWYIVATKSKDSLTTFFTACSGFRLLAALAVLFVYYLIAGRGAMLPFFLTFAVFYVSQLVNHTYFFAKAANSI